MAKDDSSIPAWQRASTSTSDSNTDQEVPRPPQPKGDDLESAESGAEQLPDFGGRELDELPPIPTREEASRFLDHPGTKNAAVDDKMRFLEVKGVRQADIEALIPESKQIYAAERAAEHAAAANDSKVLQQSSIPPVVTYPEFLVRRSKPPPLVTTEFLLNTMYATVGSVAAMYGLSRYVLGPMHEELGTARHDFFSHTSEKLGGLSERLRKLVSTEPSKSNAEKGLLADTASDTSGDSDPTELFHRDIGVQTSPPQSRRNSLARADAGETAQDPLSRHTSRLASLSTQIRELERSRSATGATEKETNDQLDSFSSYLNELMYSSPYYSYKTPSWSSQPPSTGANDEFDKFRQEVRSMKGLMLSARNFPRGGGG